jgi:hypothetical protein
MHSITGWRQEESELFNRNIGPGNYPGFTIKGQKNQNFEKIVKR